MKRERLLHLHYMLADHWKAMERLLYVDPELKGVYTFSPKQFEYYAGISPKKSSELVNFLQNFKSKAICILFRKKSNILYNHMG